MACRRAGVLATSQNRVGSVLKLVLNVLIETELQPLN